MTIPTHPTDPAATAPEPEAAALASPPFVPEPAPLPAGAQLPPVGPSASATPVVEIVPRGILYSLASIPLGMFLAVVIWRAGFVASISSLALAASAVVLYRKGARTKPQRGLVPLVAVIVVGVVLSFFAIVASDLVTFYNTPRGQSLGYPSVVDFVSANLFNGGVLGSYGRDLAMFAVFAVLGIVGTLRRLMGAPRR